MEQANRTAKRGMDGPEMILLIWKVDSQNEEGRLKDIGDCDRDSPALTIGDGLSSGDIYSADASESKVFDTARVDKILARST
jgi:hypothetical protein